MEPVTEEKPDKPDEHDPDPINKADWIREVHQDNPGLNAGDLHKLLKDEYGLNGVLQLRRRGLAQTLERREIMKKSLLSPAFSFISSRRS